MDRGEALFAESHPFGAFVRANRLPCCTMTALWMVALRPITHPEDVWESPAKAINWGRRAMGGAWWAESQVADPTRPWSALDAAVDVPEGGPGGRVVLPRVVAEATPAPQLTPGRWHLIQRWRGLGAQGHAVGGSSGHAYLVRADDDGRNCTVYQSSEAKGFRVTPGSWDGTAGLVGWTVGAVTLPLLKAM